MTLDPKVYQEARALPETRVKGAWNVLMGAIYVHVDKCKDPDCTLCNGVLIAVEDAREKT